MIDSADGIPVDRRVYWLYILSLSLASRVVDANRPRFEGKHHREEARVAEDENPFNSAIKAKRSFWSRYVQVYHDKNFGYERLLLTFLKCQ